MTNTDIAGELLAIHGLSGADAAASFHDMGKATVVEVANKGVSHSLVMCVLRLRGHSSVTQRHGGGVSGGVSFPGKKALRRCKVQRNQRYEGVGGGQISWKRALRNT